MTRRQAMGESIAWLKILSEVSAQEKAVDALFTLQAVLGAVAPGSLKDGKKVFDDVRKRLEQQAGV